MSLPDKFISQDNKRLLWELMVDNNIFTGISNNYVNNIKADFEKKVEKIKNIITVNDTILDLNKKTILQMIDEIKKYKDDALPVTSAEVLTKKQAQFQKGLQTKQEEFTRLIQPVKPQIIDFSDKIHDEPIGSEMDLKLSQTIAWREQQLSQVLEKQNPTEASEWINGKKSIVVNSTNVNSTNVNSTNVNSTNVNSTNVNSTNVNSTNVNSVHSINHIKIGDPTKIDESSFINLKKVSFAEDNNVNLVIYDTAKGRDANAKGIDAKGIDANPKTFNFMDKLKKKDIVTTELNAELNTDINNELSAVKAELNSVRTDLSKLLLDIKLILENQDVIIDKIDQVAFQTGSII